jgi:hypothetical protein
MRQGGGLMLERDDDLHRSLAGSANFSAAIDNAGRSGGRLRPDGLCVFASIDQHGRTRQVRSVTMTSV